MEMETREREERRESRFTRDGEGDGGEGLQRRTYRTLDEQEGWLSEAEPTGTSTGLRRSSPS
jgi:hypothetical protein